MPLPVPLFADPSDASIPLELVQSKHAETWLKGQSEATQNHALYSGWSGKLGQLLLSFDEKGMVIRAAIGMGTNQDRVRSRFGVVRNIGSLPEGTYHLSSTHLAEEKTQFALAWVLQMYKFDRYRSMPSPKIALVCPEDIDQSELGAIVTGEALTRDLINTPASDMGPEDLEQVTRALAGVYGASINVIKGSDLLDQNFPMIHTVGRASTQEPRLIDMTWGDAGPLVTLVGKGVCFDTGGLNIKPASSMGLMKKDMGGAAHVLGLAQMIMGVSLNIRLRVLIPAVENSISADAYRPQDILTSRKGLTVEINNTDAEGRLVLADALALADEDNPDLLICMATLTGAARVAVGPDLAPFYTDDVMLAHAISSAGKSVEDPVWEMPLHAPYESMIEPGIADLDNAPKGGFAGSITAALFLRRFVTTTKRFLHFDCYGWQPATAPARPKGGVGQGTRALFEALPKVLDL